MRSGKKIAIGWYAALDYLTAASAWLLFYFIRSKMLDDAGAYPIGTRSWLLIFVIVPIGWLILYTLAGTYHALYKKSRLFGRRRRSRRRGRGSGGRRRGQRRRRAGAALAARERQRRDEDQGDEQLLHLSTPPKRAAGASEPEVRASSRPRP